LFFFFSSSRVRLLGLYRHPSFPWSSFVLSSCRPKAICGAASIIFLQVGLLPQRKPQLGGPDPCLIFRFSRSLMGLNGYRIGHGAHEVPSVHRPIRQSPTSRCPLPATWTLRLVFVEEKCLLFWRVFSLHRFNYRDLQLSDYHAKTVSSA
jgi:hypothetical protein